MSFSLDPASTPFNELENLEQNLRWHAEQRAKKESKRRQHAAIRAVQGKSLSWQRAWLERQGGSIPDGVFEYLHVELQLALIEREEEEVLRAAAEIPRRTPSKRYDVSTFLRQLFGKRRRLPAQTILKKAAVQGIPKRTLYRAKARLGIRSERVGFGSAGRFYWFAPRQ